MIPVIRGLEFGAIVGCAAGPKADEQFLKELTDHVVNWILQMPLRFLPFSDG
jgi:hypothetical protein